MLPGPLIAGDTQMGNRETGEAGLRLRAASRRALIADLTARAGCRTREGRDRSRMVVRLHLHENVDGLFAAAIDMGVWIGEVTCADTSLDDGGIVAVGG